MTLHDTIVNDALKNASIVQKIRTLLKVEKPISNVI